MLFEHEPKGNTLCTTKHFSSYFLYTIHKIIIDTRYLRVYSLHSKDLLSLGVRTERAEERGGGKPWTDLTALAQIPLHGAKFTRESIHTCESPFLSSAIFLRCCSLLFPCFCFCTDIDREKRRVCSSSSLLILLWVGHSTLDDFFAIDFQLDLQLT